MKFAGADIEITELTWGEHKRLIKLIGEGFSTSQAELKAIVEGGSSATDMFESMPELVTKALALALRMKTDEIDKATGSEVIEAIERVIKINKLAENIDKAKKLKGLLAPPSQRPRMDEAQAEQEIKRKLALMKQE